MKAYGGYNLVGTKKLKKFGLVCHERKFCENYLLFFFCTTNFDVFCDMGMKMKRFLRTFWTSILGTSTHIFSKKLQVVTKYKTKHEKTFM